MKNKLVDQPRKIMPDTEYYKTINEISNRWFKTDLSNISEDNKIKILPYVYRTTKTTVPQLARVFGMDLTRRWLSKSIMIISPPGQGRR